MSQIKIQDLLPLLKPGWVAMDKNGEWWWFEAKPYRDHDYCGWQTNPYKICENSVLDTFDIAGFEGGWKNSLMECGK